MKTGFYPKMAWIGIRKNKRLYTPYILTCMGMVMMFYIVSSLSVSDVLKMNPGAEIVQNMLSFGVYVLGVFSLIFLFYTNSFLTRRRKKEFGLYNILGMEKRNLACILIWESLITAFVSLLGGLVAGILFSKLAELVMLNILKLKVNFSLTLETKAIFMTLMLFGTVFVLILIHMLHQIRLSNPIELLHSENAGEKPPKANWLVALAGAVILGMAYYIAVSIENPVEALVWFFVAVILVIIATYMLFIAGSVTLCRLLQKKKNYYYKTNHFVSVSSMVYRMKRNGAGLASICILCTMVLVMMSATVCLYVGTEDSLRTRYPRNINLDATIISLEQFESEAMQEIRQLAEKTAEDNGLIPENKLDYRAAVMAGYINDGHIITDDSNLAAFQLSTYSDIWQIFIIPLEDYNRIMHQNETLNPGEVIICTTKTTFKETSLSIDDMSPMKVKKTVPDFIDNGTDAMQIIPSMYIFVPDYYDTLAPIAELKDSDGESILQYHWLYGFDMDASDEAQIQMQEQLNEELDAFFKKTGDTGVIHCLLEGAAKERSGFYGLFGGLFFLGILLGVVFIFAAVLIMYYKQISEGYEDQARFEIMQKVGMTKKEIKRSINSQVLTVFFLPLMTSGVHLIFAFPMIHKLLVLFSLTNLNLLILVTAGCFLVFALFYVLVYRITSKAYYNIVSGANES